MTLASLNTSSSPLAPHQLTQLQAVISGFSASQIAWVSGYLAHAADSGGMPSNDPGPLLTILYASQTGNARSLAEDLGRKALARGLRARVESVADFRPRDIVRLRLLLLVVSTHGEGEPPESAVELHAYLNGKRAPALRQLNYAVLGLGDSSYEYFCKAAEDFDKRLHALGAKPIVPRRDCDVDFQSTAERWGEQALEQVVQQVPENGAQVVAFPGARPVATPVYHRDDPCQAQLLERRRISADSARADVRHLVLGIDPDALRYSPGDALGVWARNASDLVEAVLSPLALDGGSEVVLSGESMSLRQALTERRELTQLHPSVVTAWAQLAGARALRDLSAHKARLRAFASERQVIDLVACYPARLDPQALADLLQPLQPRLYSIASSQAEYEDEVHLTVSVVRYQAHGRDHLGAASGFLGERLQEDAPLRVYPVENPAFRLPSDGNRPLIMIAAGTGIAPFRAFLQQRAANRDQGRNWLLFGNRHFNRDFLYQTDWQAFRKRGLLDRVSLAFSRDSAQRVYVQQRLAEQGRELYAWLREGAHLYVCGGVDMGQEVEQTLLRVIRREGATSPEAADEYLAQMRREGRYQRDLY